MATKTGGKRKSTGTRSTSSRSNRSAKSTGKQRTVKEFELMLEVKTIIACALGIFLFVCNFGVVGKVGNALSSVMFGLFGLLAYVFPVLLAVIFVYLAVNIGKTIAVRQSVAAVVLFFAVGIFLELINGYSRSMDKAGIKAIYEFGVSEKKGGGLLSCLATFGLLNWIDKVGTVIVAVLLVIVCLILLFERSLFNDVRNMRDHVIDRSLEEREFRKKVSDERDENQDRRLAARQARNEERLRLREEHEERVRQRRLEREERENRLREQKELKKQTKSDEELLRKNQKVSGVTKDTVITDEDGNIPETDPIPVTEVNNDIHEININGFDPVNLTLDAAVHTELTEVYVDDEVPEVKPEEPEIFSPTPKQRKAENTDISSEISASSAKRGGTYKKPPLNLLKKAGGRKTSKNNSQLNDTANKLIETLNTFDVKATLESVVVGPSITRFELKPQLGVKVSRIKSLSDDIKLSLATTDIRIEAPIPGKSLIGIEVPNRESEPVLLGDLIDNNEFKDSKSNTTFAVGKDISGKNIIFDIDKFPHVLIAGATGSGKSVCINTLIMSILYKAHPDDVKLIMIDPKVVELSVYNGIPHLLLPVVTDAKKAAATLNYAVSEMMERYNKFADAHVRDLEGYNSYVEEHAKENGEGSELIKKLPQIVIIVDELADLMMVARNEVEDSICRLAQLARAAGIHLVIATQRPSVDVITGLIKANMPSRIAFAVSSGVDSRTILDSVGAEELLGRGDMLFFPKGFKNPVRLQGGFVSDGEVGSVVDFLKSQGIASSDTSVEEKINSMNVSGSKGSTSDSVSDDDIDDKFIEAGKYVIQSNSASIGQLQRKFKMGFNRAARIMDQLEEAGVVGPAEGTKPREILMSPMDFDNYIENSL